jgi:ADP-heptose:LPS heptosyltransferase
MTAESILIYVGLDRMGDGLMKLPFVRAVRGAWPEARVTWLAGKGASVYAGRLAPLVQGLIDEVIQEAGVGLAARELLSRPLPGRRFDLVLDTQRRVLTTLILKRVRHDVLVSGTAGYLLSDRRPHHRHGKPASMIRQLMELVEVAAGVSIDTPMTPLAIPEAVSERASRRLPPGPTYVGLAPGAGDSRKCWPLERFVESAAALIADGLSPVWFLGPDEQDLQTPLAAALPDALFPLADGHDDPLTTVAIAHRLAVAVANDSGNGHLFAAADCPLVSLFGPTSAAKFAPMASRLEIVEARSFGGESMSAIPTGAVVDAVRRQLRRAAAGA